MSSATLRVGNMGSDPVNNILDSPKCCRLGLVPRSVSAL